MSEFPAPQRFPGAGGQQSWPARVPSRWRSLALHVVLFLLTVASVYAAGGPDLALGLISILFAHEMGHYLTARAYGIDATLPYFIPFPIPGFTLVGTLGAVIRIRSPFPDRRALFDVGIAGPLAGFVICIPVLLMGVWEATVQTVQPGQAGLSLGEPLLFQWTARLIHGPLGPNETLWIGSWGLAAWFGLFVTGLNLIPIGQLDGGHATYALFGAKRHDWISRLAFWVCLSLAWFGPQWLFWAFLMKLLGRRHPPTEREHLPLGPGRKLVAALGAVVFVLCFVPDPIQFSWSEFSRELLELIRS